MLNFDCQHSAANAQWSSYIVETASNQAKTETHSVQHSQIFNAEASIETKQMIKPTQKYPSYHAGGLNPSSMILGYFSMLNLMVENGKKKYIE